MDQRVETSLEQALRIKSFVALTLAFFPQDIPSTWPARCTRDRKRSGGAEIMIHCDRLFIPFSVLVSHSGMGIASWGLPRVTEHGTAVFELGVPAMLVA
jgi:hypothetical protein